MRRAALVFGCASVLLSYPGDEFAADLAAVRAALPRLGRHAARAHLARALDQLSAPPATERAALYVRTFDLRRRRSLHLTWYRHGETRERGTALAALAGVYREAGVSLVSGELPDFLPALLELAAVAPAGTAVLREHRGALEALRSDLAEEGSPYAGVVQAVLGVLGGLTQGERARAARLRAEGPPSERVGLERLPSPQVGAGGGSGPGGGGAPAPQAVTIGGRR